MAARKTIRRAAGTHVPAKPGKVQVPLHSEDVFSAIRQMQETLNEMQTQFNAHTHSGVTAGAGTSGAPSAGTTVTGTARADATLFTPADAT